MKNNKTDKKEIMNEVYNFVSKYDFEGDINKVAEKIKTIPKRLIAAYPLNDEYKKVHRFAIRQDYETDYGCNDSHDIYILQIYRWETDEELKNRLEYNKTQATAAKEKKKKLQEAKVKREKTLFENLKKKFG